MRCGAVGTILGCRVVEIVGVMAFDKGAAPLGAMPTACVAGAASGGIFALVPHYLSLRFANAVRSFGMGLAYAVAAFSQAIATWTLPATSRGIGLPLTIGLFVIASSLAVAAIIIREPSPLPGEAMEAEGEGRRG